MPTVSFIRANCFEMEVIKKFILYIACNSAPENMNSTAKSMAALLWSFIAPKEASLGGKIYSGPQTAVWFTEWPLRIETLAISPLEVALRIERVVRNSALYLGR